MHRLERMNLWLLILVLLLGALVWLTLQQGRPVSWQPLTGIDPARVERITIHNQRGEFTLRREAGRWRLQGPAPAAADPARVRSLLKILTTPSRERFPAPESGLEAFGLAHPRAWIEIDGTRIWLGGTHPYNHHRYLRIGETIHLVKDIFPHHFLAGAQAFRATPTPGEK